VFLAEDEAEFRMVMIEFIIFRFENNHNPILEEIIEVQRVRIKALSVKVVYSTAGECIERSGKRDTHSFSGRSTWKQMTSPS
jgi:hypothetical protein